MKFVLIFAIAAATCSAWSDSAGVVAHRDVEGYYVSKSTRCTIYDEERKSFVSCADESTDCLKLVPQQDGRVLLEVQSTQANMHQCNYKGVGVFERDAFRFNVGKQGTMSLSVEVAKNMAILRLHLREGEAIPGCGEHATFDGLTFRKSRSIPVAAACQEK